MARVKCPKCFHVNPDGEDKCTRCGQPLPRIRIDARPGPTPASPDPTEPQFTRGQVVAARYSVLNLIGRGGMGAIYKVHDNVLGETVALKTLLPQFVRDKMVVERFFNEAKIARRLAHPNIVRVHDIGNAEGSVYISMEYVQGISLRAMLEAMPAGQRLALVKVLTVIDALCAALEYAHQFTVHRDIKPENIMVTADGTVKLMDFGISKLMADTRMTAASMVMGTPFYMSPEQLKNSRDVDARADIYSVGVLLYESLTGNVPTGVPKPASQVSSEVPPALDGIILKCVATDPRERYANATELRAALKPILDLVQSGGDLTRLQKPKPEEKTERAALPWRKIAGWGLLLALTLGSIAGLMKLETQRKTALIAAQESAGALPEEPAAPSPEGAIPWSDFVSLVQELDRVATLKSGESPEFTDTYRRARALWQNVSDKGPELSPEQQTTARRALQYYVATLMGAQTQDMAFIADPQVQVKGKTVQLEPFFIDKHEVSNAEWQRFCSGTSGQYLACLTPAPPDASELPVVFVSFFDAEAYAAARKKLLPTSNQWEAAAYSTVEPGKPYPWGEEIKPDAANFNGVVGAPEPVGAHDLDTTKNGIADLAGNVAEWTRTPADTTGRANPDFGVPMVVRGGSFSDDPLPLDAQRPVEFSTRNGQIGFRCVMEIPTDPAAVRELLRKVS